MEVTLKCKEIIVEYKSYIRLNGLSQRVINEGLTEPRQMDRNREDQTDNVECRHKVTIKRSCAQLHHNSPTPSTCKSLQD